MQRIAPSLALFAAVLAASLAPAVASARMSDEVGYDYDKVWRAAVRLVAVDFRFPVTDRDPEIGYLLFDYQEQGRSYPGSIELVRVRAADESERVRVVVRVEGMPSYVERMLLDRFTRKLVDDYGPPRAVRPARRPPPERDANAPSEEDRD